MIVYALIGGIGTILGPILGAGIMLFVTQVLLSRLLEVHMLITGAIVVAIVLLMPGGVLGVLRDLPWRRRKDGPRRETARPGAAE